MKVLRFFANLAINDHLLSAYPQRAKPAKKASVHWGSRPLMVIPSHSESDILELRQDNVTCVVALLQ